MARSNRNTAVLDETTEAPVEDVATEGTEEATEATVKRGDVGTVSIRKSTRTNIPKTRTRTTTDPIFLGVQNAVKGEWYDVTVANDEDKIARVERKLRSFAQKLGVGMHISPERPYPVATDENGNEIPGHVFVAYYTDDRAVRPRKADDGEGTESVTE